MQSNAVSWGSYINLELMQLCTEAPNIRSQGHALLKPSKVNALNIRLTKSQQLYHQQPSPSLLFWKEARRGKQDQGQPNIHSQAISAHGQQSSNCIGHKKRSNIFHFGVRKDRHDTRGLSSQGHLVHVPCCVMLQHGYIAA
eukprot:1158394-Pelagomonas_calceolata.AAC.1